MGQQQRERRPGWVGYTFLSLMIGFLGAAAFFFGPPLIFGLLGIPGRW